MIYNLYKQRGETPLQCIQRFAAGRPELKGEKMTYLGRLDPLAEGVLLMASGDDVKRKEEFLGLDKEYDFVAIFGFATDTYDVLGRIMRVEKLSKNGSDREAELENEIRKVAQIYEGERDQKYPEYSSKMIASRKSFRPDPAAPAPIEAPVKKVTIHELQFHKLETLKSKELFGRLLMDISRVRGDFGQHEVLALWRQFLFGSEGQYFIGKFSAHVSSGTYIRGLVNDMGNTLGFGATTLSIKRNRVGDYKIEDSLK